MEVCIVKPDRIFFKEEAEELLLPTNTGYIGIIAIPTIVCLSAYFGAKYAISNMPRKIVTQIFLAAISLGILRYAIDVISKF